MCADNIYYLRREQIDADKWDACIRDASNGRIYGYSVYLDAMAEHWDALVLSTGDPTNHDYEAVMPLTWKRKWGVYYLYQPFLTAQLGIFGKNISDEKILHFIQQIPFKFKLIEISLNSANIIHASEETLRSNYVLDLQPSYDIIYCHYRGNVQRNIKKAVQAGCRVSRNIDVQRVIDLALQQMNERGHQPGRQAQQFAGLYQKLQALQMAETYGVFLGNQLVASSVFFLSHQRAYYILVGNHPNGKTIGASHLLIDAFIKDHSDSNLKLDFEGSDINSLAFFYSSFGALNEPYPFLKINRLRWPMKLLKR